MLNKKRCALVAALIFWMFLVSANASQITLSPPPENAEYDRLASQLLEFSQKQLYKGVKPNKHKPKDQLSKVSIVISQAMSSQDLVPLMELASKSEGEISLVLTGMNEGQTGIFDAIRPMWNLAKKHGHSPTIFMEPFIAKELNIKKAPTLIYRHEGKTLVVSGRMDYKTFQKKLESFEGLVMDEGVQGPVVEISEINLMDIIAQRINSIDWEEKRNKAVSRYWKRVAGQWKLPVVQKDSQRELDLSVVVPDDQIDDKGRVYLRKGQVINPLEKMAFTSAVIVFNGASQKEVNVALSMREQAKSQNLNPVLITTGLPGDDKNALGKLYDIFGTWVYFLDKPFKERFDIRATPSMVAPTSNGRVSVIEMKP